MTPRRPPSAEATDRIECGAKLGNLPAVQSLVAEVCRRERIDERTCHHLQLIVEEACVNVVHHAYPAGQGGPLGLEVRIVERGGQRRVVLTLEDQGRPFDPLAAPPADTTAPLESRELGGLGVHLIRQFSDRLHYQRDPLRGNVLTIEKCLLPSAPH